MKRENTRQMVMTSVSVALIVILSQISIPMPFGVPITLQTLGIALAGFMLGPVRGAVAVAVFLALGAIGLPVFSGFQGGAHRLVGVTGGFLWGFLVLAALCGLSTRRSTGRAQLALGLVGLVTCHLMGIVQYMLVTGNPFMAAAWTMSIPFLPKDVASIAAAWYLAARVRRAILTPRAEAG